VLRLLFAKINQSQMGMPGPGASAGAGGPPVDQEPPEEYDNALDGMDDATSTGGSMGGTRGAAWLYQGGSSSLNRPAFA
jgi:hypothetical protein